MRKVRPRTQVPLVGVTDSTFLHFYYQTFYTAYVLRRVHAVNNWGDKLRTIFYGPSWLPGRPRLGLEEDKIEVVLIVHNFHLTLLLRLISHRSSVERSMKFLCLSGARVTFWYILFLFCTCFTDWWKSVERWVIDFWYKQHKKVSTLGGTGADK